MATKLNVNIRTLLTNCEDLVKDEINHWRLKKLIKSLDTMIAELGELETDNSQSKVPDYKNRLQSLKNLVNYIESPSAANNLRKVQSTGAVLTSDEALKEAWQMQNSKQFASDRKELLDADALRRRKPEQLPAAAAGEAGKFYTEAQEKITEHMLTLTRNLKEQTQTANKIIKKDTELVQRSTGMADRNMNSLQKENTTLADHSRNAWKCWMWLMFAFVIATFVGMVLFMKIMKKKV